MSEPERLPNSALPETSADPRELRDVAVRVAQSAAGYVRAGRPDTRAVQTKSSPTDPVTVVDTETEARVRASLRELRPGDSVLGEEEGGSASPTAGGVHWVVDPIDGTVNFLYGIPAYAVSVAAQVDGRSVAGAVVDVAGGITYCAALGAGATRITDVGEKTTLRCNDVDSVAMALLATGFSYGARRRAEQGRLVAALLPRVRDIRRIGSAALDLCMVAAGLVDGHYEHGLNPWDWAAGALIAAEAGAYVRVPSAESRSSAGEVVVACAPGIADELAAVFAELGVDAPIPES